MKIEKKKIGVVFAVLLLLLCLITYISISRGQTCKGVEYKVCYHSDTLITADDLKTYVKTHCGKIKGELKRKVNMYGLEAEIMKWPYADSVRISTDVKGILHINVVQAEVMARVINKKGNSFYIAKNGKSAKMLPYSGKVLRVLLVNGNIDEYYRSNYVLEQDTGVCSDIFKISDFISRDLFWKAQISQIYVVKKGMYHLAPTVGRHLIVLGDAENLDRKFENLMNIYKQGFNKAGWDRYSSVSLRFGDRIPCQKRKL